MEEKNYTIALLIDTDNISAKYISVLMKELIALGKVTYKRMYGDFTAQARSGWRDLVNQYSITPVQQYSYTQGKNVTDSKMIIDAMDILYTGNVDAFCIMSSDSDFTGIAKRLKESNMFVIGAGESKTPGSFINACDRFFKLDSLISRGKKSTAKEEPIKKEEQQKKGKQTNSVAAKKKKEPKPAEKEPKELKEFKQQQQTQGTPIPQYRERPMDGEEDYITPREEIEDFVLLLFESSGRTELPLSVIMQKIFQAYPDFNPKDYGVSKARKFFDGTQQFSQKKGKGTEVLICLKEDL